MMIWAHSAIFPARPADVIAAGADVISHVCYLGYEAQPAMLAAYEDRTPVDETRLAPTGDDPVVAGLYRAMAKQGTILTQPTTEDRRVGKKWVSTWSTRGPPEY